MARDNQVYVYIGERSERKVLLDALCERAGLEPSHSAYRAVIDAAMVAFAAGLTKNEKGEDEMETVEISGSRYQVCDDAWAGWVGDATPAGFMDGHEDAKAAVDEYVAAIPEMFGEEPPTFYWREMNAEYTLAELLIRYLEDHEDEL